jgi:hypothetical protein
MGFDTPCRAGCPNLNRVGYKPTQAEEPRRRGRRARWRRCWSAHWTLLRTRRAARAACAAAGARARRSRAQRWPSCRCERVLRDSVVYSAGQLAECSHGPRLCRVSHADVDRGRGARHRQRSGRSVLRLQIHADVEGADLGDDWVARCQAAVAGLLQDNAYAARCAAARLVPRLFPLFPDLQARAPALVTGATVSAVQNGHRLMDPNRIQTVPSSTRDACREHCLGLLGLAPAQEPEERNRKTQSDVRPCITHHSPGRYRRARRSRFAGRRRQPDIGCMGCCRQATFSEPGGLQARLCLESLPGVRAARAEQAAGHMETSVVMLGAPVPRGPGRTAPCPRKCHLAAPCGPGAYPACARALNDAVG